MSEMGKLLGEDTLRFERVLPGGLEETWEYLVNGEKRGKWLSEGDVPSERGASFEMRFDHRRLPGGLGEAPEKYREYAEGHTTRCRVLEIEAPRVLEISWAEGEIYESVVRFELFERGKETLLVLTHRGLKGREAMLGTLGGWHTHLEILCGEQRGAFWDRHLYWEGEYQKEI
jgi:uncharacterized protein YndB with AHSA1/START domain